VDIVMLMIYVVVFWNDCQSFAVTHCCLLHAKVV